MRRSRSLRLIGFAVALWAGMGCMQTSQTEGGRVEIAPAVDPCPSLAPFRRLVPDDVTAACHLFGRANFTATVTAVPDAGHRFLRWEGAASCGSEASCSLTVPLTASVHAIFEPAPPAIYPEAVFVDTEGVVYLFDDHTHTIHRYLLEEARWLSPIVLEEDVRSVSYAPDLHRIYVAYGLRITKIDLHVSRAELPFVDLVTASSVVAMGPWLFAGTHWPDGQQYRVYAPDGSLVSSQPAADYLDSGQGAPEAGRVFAMRTSSFRTPRFMQLDPATGELGETFVGTPPDDAYLAPPIRVSPDGQRIAVGSGHLLDPTTLELIGRLPLEFQDAVWIGDDLATLEFDAGATWIEQRDPEGRIVGLGRFPGAPIRILPMDGDPLVVTSESGLFRFHRFRADRDFDEDGVEDFLDDFPFDPAAAVDTDGDGSPDAWLGAPPDDPSRTLDAFPLDSACSLPSHAVPGDPGTCDIGAGLPAYAPDEIAIDDAGTIHLLSTEHERIFRWSAAENAHANPVVLDGPATHMAWWPAEGFLQLGYEDGTLASIVPGDAVPEERLFEILEWGPTALASIGDFLFVAHYARNFRYTTFRADGSLAAFTTNARSGEGFIGDPASGRVHYVDTFSEPNWVAVDPVSGALTTRYSSFDGRERPPLRPAPDGERVLGATGFLHDVGTGAYRGALPREITDAVWLPDGELVSIGPGYYAGTSQTLVEHRLADGRLNDRRFVPGDPLRILRWDGGLVVVSEEEGRPAFHGYTVGTDADGDGVANLDDAFPDDPSASVDGDHDGAPDAWNPGRGPGDSTTGLVLDAFPDDSGCQLVEHTAYRGGCDVERALSFQTPLVATTDGNGIVYVLGGYHNRIYRWSIADETHLNPLVVPIGARDLAYEPVTETLLVANGRAPITRHGLDELGPGTVLADPEGEVSEMLAADGRLFVVAERIPGERLVAFDAETGAELDAVSGEQNLAWLPVAGDLIYPDRFHSRWRRLPFDPEAGAFGNPTSGTTIAGGVVRPPLHPSRDGELVLTKTGVIAEVETGRVVRAVPSEVIDAVWLEDGGLVVITSSGAFDTRLDRHAADGMLLETRVFEGRPFTLLDGGEALVVVTTPGSRIGYHRFVPDDDLDDDGTANDEDAYPFDPAAASDSDGDGAPDAWNPGRGPGDSTTGLVLDAFPEDSACQLAEHAVPGDPTRCDHAGRVPAYVPDAIVIDDAGVLHLLSSEEQKLFRWSATQQEHLNPVFLDEEALSVAYSAALDRLYVSHQSGGIVAVDSDGTLPDSFSTTPNPAVALVAMGDRLHARQFNAYATFEQDGTLIDAASGGGAGVVWSESLGRLYSRSGSKLAYVQFDPTTGLPNGSGVWRWDIDLALRDPLFASDDGLRILAGSGDVHDAQSLERLGTIGAEPVAAAFAPDGSIIALVGSAEEGTSISQWNPAYLQTDLAWVPGSPLGVFAFSGGMVVVTLLDGEPVFHLYVPGDDGDGDGVPFDADAFPVDPAASVDSDRDGRPDSWNPGQGPTDSTTNLVLDAFPFDAACQDADQALPGSPEVCDVARTIPFYVPLQIEIRPDGTVLALDPAHGRIHRWSAALGTHLDPIPIRENVEYMAYSDESELLHLADDAKRITQLDLAAPVGPAGLPIERFFLQSPLWLDGLAAAGPWLLISRTYPAHDRVTYDAGGNEVFVAGLRDGLFRTTWFPGAQRLFGFSSSSSRRLYYVPIDPVTGENGEPVYTSPYWYPAGEAPARVSRDGRRVLTARGDIFDGDDLSFVSALPEPITDAVWLDEHLLTLRAAPGGGALVEQRSLALDLQATTPLAGDPLRLLEWSGGWVAVTLVDGRPAYQAVDVLEDWDADGFPLADDAFPVDPAAAIDEDGDGAPDEWNAGFGPEDSTTGLVLDAFPDDFGCQRPEHGIAGVCDVRFVLPDDPATPLCDFTDVPPSADGSLPIGGMVDFAPLCAGWILVAPRASSRIELHNAFDGRVSRIFEFSSEVGPFELDAPAHVLYVALPDASALAVLDLTDGSVEEIATPGAVDDLALAPSGDVFVSIGGTNPFGWVLPADGDTFSGGWPLAGRYLRHHPSRSELFTMNDSSSRVTRYDYEPVAGLTASQTLYTGTGLRDFALSADGNRLVVVTYLGNERSQTLYDYDPADFSIRAGSWRLEGRFPNAAAFDGSGERLAIADEDEFVLFDALSFEERSRSTAAACPGRIQQMAFATDDSVVFGSENCQGSTPPFLGHLHWRATEP